MSNLLDKPLAQIVLDDFQTVHVFEKYGLDFCCNGKQTLQDACRDKGIQTEQILEQLDVRSGERNDCINFAHLSLSELADYIVNVHHSYVRESTPLILNQIFKITTKHGDRFPHMKQVYILFTQIKTELLHHMEKEEQIVFPRIKELENSCQINNNKTSVSNPIHLMEEEHELAGRLMRQIRNLTNDYQVPENVCTTFRLAMNALHHFEADLHKHVHLENNILFPKAKARL